MRVAVRRLARERGFSGAVVLTLAVTLGANAALFAVAHELLLRPLPYTQPSRLVVLSSVAPDGSTATLVSAADYLAWKLQTPSLAGVAAFRPWGFVLTGRGDAQRLTGARVSANLFDLLGERPVAGRGFLPSEDVYGGPPVAIVSERLWRERLGAAADLSNTSIVLSGTPRSVVGVLPSTFALPEADVWTPLALEPFAIAQRGTRSLTVVARMRDAAAVPQLNGELDAIARSLGDRFEPERGWGVAAVPLVDHLVGRFRPTIEMLWAAVALVLVIACANIAALLLTRAAGRRQELAICRALGATPLRLFRRALSESLVLALVAACLAIPVAQLLLRTAVAIAPPELPRLDAVAMDWRAIVFTFVLAAASAVVFGTLPARKLVRDGMAESLRDGRGSVDAGSPLVRHAAVACQIALAMVVLIGAALLVRSLARVLAVEIGFQPRGVLTASVSLPDSKYGSPQKRQRFFDALLDRLRALPGVAAAGTVSHVPLGGAPLMMDVADAAAGSRAPHPVECSVVGGDWFAAMTIPFSEGRAFGAEDTSDTRRVAVVNQRLAERLWPGRSAVGRHLVSGVAQGADPTPREVVGVVADVRTTIEAVPAEHVYLPYSQNPWPTMSVAVRANRRAEDLAAPVREAIHALDPDQAVYNLRPLTALYDRASAQRRFQVAVLGAFALVAVLLAILGSYSLVAYGVRQRRREIGVRLALGAGRGSVLRLALRGALRAAVTGIAAGIALGVAAARLMAGLLFGITPADTVTFVSAGLLVFVLAAAASTLAARAAAEIDPLTALRDV